MLSVCATVTVAEVSLEPQIFILCQLISYSPCLQQVLCWWTQRPRQKSVQPPRMCSILARYVYFGEEKGELVSSFLTATSDALNMQLVLISASTKPNRKTFFFISMITKENLTFSTCRTKPQSRQVKLQMLSSHGTK